MECKFDYIFIVGENESGKSTFARELSEATGLRVGETSRCLDGPLARVLCQLPYFTAATPQDMLRDIGNNKDQFRAAKRAIGDELCKVDCAYLMQVCVIEGARIVVGMRRAEEIRAFMDTMPASRSMIMFVMYRGAPGDADIVPMSSFLPIPIQLEEIYNDGNVEQLRAKARQVAAAMCR